MKYGRESCYAGSRWSLDKWVLSLLWKMASDSAVLTVVRGSFHHWCAKTEKSRDFTERALFSLSDGGTSRPADVEERGGLTGACGLTSVLEVDGCKVPLTLKASTIVEVMEEGGVTWEKLGRFVNEGRCSILDDTLQLCSCRVWLNQTFAARCRDSR